MSEEEAIKILENKVEKSKKIEIRNNPMLDIVYEIITENRAIETILDLYNKEKEKNKKYQGIENGTTIIFKSKAKYVREDRIEKYYINKNKIREKIKDLKKEQEEYKDSQEWEIQDDIVAQIEVLEELLGE